MQSFDHTRSLTWRTSIVTLGVSRNSNFSSPSSIFPIQDGPSPLHIAKIVHGLDHPVTALLTSLDAIDLEMVDLEDEDEFEFDYSGNHADRYEDTMDDAEDEDYEDYDL